MGAEVHAGTTGELDSLLRFRPSPASPVVVHLPRSFDLRDPAAQQRILELAAHGAGRVYGLLLHDHPDMAVRPAEYRQAATELDSRLQRIAHAPLVFVEYAACLAVKLFAGFFESIRGLTRVSAAIDIGHVGIHQAQLAFGARHPGADVCALKTLPAGLPQQMEDVEAAVGTALPAVLSLIDALGALGKPVHFHLHDGHPLSAFSEFGVCDHLSFLWHIPLPFEFRGRRSARLMFGPRGLERICARARQAIGPARASFSLEIHPQPGRLPLQDAAGFFSHWRDPANAERMNYWLSVLSENHVLLQAALASANPSA